MIKTKIVQSLESIEKSDWDLISHPDFPFSNYAYLASLEKANCLGERTGWFPRYFLAFKEDRLVFAHICFLKTNSYGEYIFDWEWAQAYASNGLNYYPKLTSAIPFTPATGPKTLLDIKLSQTDRDFCYSELFKQLGTIQASSHHNLFTAGEERQYFLDAGYELRHSFQYHWHNKGYRDFADFQDQLIGKKRRQITKERRSVNAQSLTIQRLVKGDLQPEHAEVIYEFYLTTLDKKHGIPYLTKDFFVRCLETMKNEIMLCLAYEDDRAVAMSFSFYKGKKLYGRYWGGLPGYDALHFELCYYQLIEFAIEHKLEIIEAGAQGAHKIKRGFDPVINLSTHSIRHPSFRSAINRFIAEERAYVAAHVDELLLQSAYRKQSGSSSAMQDKTLGGEP